MPPYIGSPLIPVGHGSFPAVWTSMHGNALAYRSGSRPPGRRPVPVRACYKPSCSAGGDLERNALVHPQNIPPPPLVCGKIVFHKTGQKGWGLCCRFCLGCLHMLLLTSSSLAVTWVLSDRRLAVAIITWKRVASHLLS